MKKLFTILFLCGSLITYAQTKSEDVKSYINTGYSYFQQKSFSKAINTFEKAQKLMPEYPYTYYYLCISYVAKNDSKKALTYYDEFKRLAPDEKELQFDLRCAMQAMEN
ncbi:hypothetical protein FACS1894182_09850 [Bacteroidia bacterium]|nr:hypothetical protein FACS1894182_09850 [Bacteroidia bacterium]